MPEDQAQTLPARKEPGKPLMKSGKGRVSAVLREALRLRVYEALPWDDCARQAGMAPSGLYKARTRPHVRAELEKLQSQYMQEIEAQRAPLKALAIQQARNLLQDAKSESVKARMVEFLAGEPKGNGANVTVNVQQNNVSGGYAYVRPGQQIVDITPSEDQQAADNEGDETTE